MKPTIIQVIVLIMLCFLFISETVFSQEECQLQLDADIQHCTCLNNGEIIFKLTKNEFCQLDTDNIRYSLYSPLNGISSENSISPIFSSLPPGDYTGVVSALHYTGAPGSGANIIVRDTLSMHINTSYTSPTLGLLENEYTVSNPFGKVRALPCKATGIIQLHIKGGRFPYQVEVLRHDGSLYQHFRTVIFNNHQHSGTNPSKMDYNDYYNIDSLPAGNYKFVLTDACGYMPYYVETSLAETPLLNTTTSINTNALNTNIGVDSNTVYILDFMWNYVTGRIAKNADYYAERQRDGIETYWELRWIDPSVNGNAPDTSSWSPIVFGTYLHPINAATKYCDLWGKTLEIQIRDVNCNSIKSYYYHIKKPANTFTYDIALSTIPGSSRTFTDSCGLIRTDTSKNMYKYHYKVGNEWDRMLTPKKDGKYQIHYIVKDFARDTVIMQGISAYVPSNVFTYQNEFYFDRKYHGKKVSYTVLDAQSCKIDEKTFNVSAVDVETFTRPSIFISEKNLVNSYCFHSSLDLQIDNTIYFSDHDTISITESCANLSNCAAYYDESLNQWIRCDSNTSITISGDNHRLTIHDVKVGGHATVKYKHGCYLDEHEYPLNLNSSFQSYFEPTEAYYITEPTCNGIRIIPQGGDYKQYSFKHDDNTIYESKMWAFFRFYGNPYSPESITGYYRAGEAVEISLEGDVRITQTPFNALSPNYECLYIDTIIKCQKRPLEYDYFYSYCCQIGDTASTVRTRAKGGVPPYLYVISDQNGNMLDSNRTGDFYNLPLPHHDTVRLKVYDQCGTNFIYNGQVIEQQLIKKVWFEDGTAQKTIADSNWCQIFAINLDKMDYHWEGPNGFSSDEQNPLFFIPVDSNMSGKYYLSLQDSVCGLIRDSLTLKVNLKSHIPELLWIDDSICSGSDYINNGFFITSMPSDTESVLYDTLISPLNDSTFLKLTLLPVYNIPTPDSIVTPLDEYHFGGYTLTDTGLYEIKLKSSCGCDSVVYVHLMFSKYLPCPDAIDYNGNHYSAIRINKYCWTTENLKSSNYSDGRPIERIYEYTAPDFPNTAANVEIFGRLYDWFAAIDTGAHQTTDTNGNVRGICPQGWLLPSEEDFDILRTFTPQQLRSPNYWLNNPGNNESGFNSLPAGYYDALRQRYSNLLGNAYYWSSRRPDMQSYMIQIIADCLTFHKGINACNGYSIRCIKKDDEF